jgi:hypothetical protein
MKMSESISELATALSKFQGEVKNPHNEAVNPQFRSKYAPLDVVINTVKPLLASHGLSFIQSTSTDGENVGITTLLLHESGEWIESDTLYLPAYQLKSGGAKEFNAQAIGSSTTYGRRYSLSAALGLSSEDDDDANGQVFGGQPSTAATATKQTPPEPNAREEAKAKAHKAAEERKEKAAAARANQSAPETPKEEVAVQAEDVLVEPINATQLKAVGTMLKMIQKKDSDFDKDAFIKILLTGYGIEELEQLSFEQAREVVPKINAEMRKLKES